MILEDRLLAAMSSRSGRKVMIVDCRKALRAVDPVVASAVDSRQRLLDLLVKLRDRGQVTFPSDRSWDREGRPPLPLFVTLVVERKVREMPVAIQWHPTMAFGANYSKGRDLLSRINEWVKANPTPYLSVPIQERSLQILGHEKQLGSILGLYPMLAGVDLGIYQCVTPLPVRKLTATTGRGVLVVENMATWDSFSQWNETAARWDAVVFGGGKSLFGSHTRLDELLLETGGGPIEYFGDLDGTGIHIPYAVNDLRSARSLPTMKLHVNLYKALVDKGLTRPEKVAASAVSTKELKSLLPRELADGIQDIWQRGLVLPQEGIGTQDLHRYPTITA